MSNEGMPVYDQCVLKKVQKKASKAMATTSLDLVDKIINHVESNSTKEDANKNQSSSKTKIKSRHFLDNNETIVSDCIDGAVVSNSKNKITRIFTSDPSIKVVYRTDFDKENKVALISGGGSGHEPSHAGFVGKGMLTAAVCGEIFASPPTKAVVAAIKAVGGPKGVLLIVKNYTGDVLCFTLAASIAKEKYGINTEIIIVGDDCAIGRKKAGRVGRRGIAATVFVHKIAGHLAENGKMSVFEIKTFLEKTILPNMGSIGIASTSCYLPGSGMIKQERIKPNSVELGLGIHGESGAMTIEFEAISKLIPKMFDILFDTDSDRNYIDFLSKNANEKKEVVIMVNNLGGTTEIEMGIIIKYVLLYLNNEQKQFNFDIKRIFCGRYMTALDMNGFSLSLLSVNEQILAALDASVDPIAWIPGYEIDFKTLMNGGLKMNEIMNNEQQSNDDVKVNNIEDDVLLNDEQSKILQKMIKCACCAIEANKDKLNKLDNVCGDGDCGSTLDFGRKLLLNAMQKFKFESLNVTLRDIGECIAEMGGSSGAIYGYFFISASKWIKNECKGKKLNGLNVSNAFYKAVNDLSAYCGAKQNNRTMIDALFPAIKALTDYYSKHNDLSQALSLAAKAALNGAENTKTMKAEFGRSVYIPTSVLKDVVDPGAFAVAVCIDSIAKNLFK